MRWFQIIITKFVVCLQQKHKFIYVNELPEKISDKTIYIIGEKEHPWLLAFNCPCGCHDFIQLNLLKAGEPCWNYKVTKKKKINISPSIWRTFGCRSHFYIRKSQVKWIENY